MPEIASKPTSFHDKSILGPGLRLKSSTGQRRSSSGVVDNPVDNSLTSRCILSRCLTARCILSSCLTARCILSGHLTVWLSEGFRRISDIRNKISEIVIPKSDTRFPISEIVIPISEIIIPTSDFRYPISEIAIPISDIRYAEAEIRNPE